jgi:hypothetical protein
MILEDVQMHIGSGSAPSAVSNQTLSSGQTILAKNIKFINNNYAGNTFAEYSVTAGTSPYTFPLLPNDTIYILTTANGISGLTLDGQSVTTTANIRIFVGAGHTLVATWSSTASVFEVIP